MSGIAPAFARLAEIPNLQVSADAMLAPHTRFGIGGPADIYAETPRVESFLEAVRLAQTSGLDWTVIGGGANLIVSDEGFRGIVLRFTGEKIEIRGHRVVAEAGAALEHLVEAANRGGLRGLETLAGIPGSVGGAVCGNAGAYGRSIAESVSAVYFFDGALVRALGNAECAFAYRESVFKRRRDWVILTVALDLAPAEPAALRRRSVEILAQRRRKYPQEMKCAGSIFKNLLLGRLPEAVRAIIPPEVIREGKVPAAWFLEQAGAKGASRGDFRVADYHANLIYHAGAGTARDLCALIRELKALVRDRFGVELEEEVQYLGFDQ